MKAFSFADILKAANGSYFGDEALLTQNASAIVIYSRKAVPGSLYVPIIGERYDGHDFIDAARICGAALVLSDHALSAEPYILVQDTLEALQSIAAAYRARFDIPVIGITGSVGKTSTKEMIAAALSTRYTVVKTFGSENNQTGVPLTVFRFEESHDAAIVEMGTNHFGEIEALSKIAQPDICLFTNIGVAHIEFFGSREGIFEGKTEMLKYMRKNGTVIVNGDDDLLATLPGAVRYGMSDGCSPRAVDIRDCGLDGMAFTAVCGDERAFIQVPAPGEHSVSNALAAIAVGLTLGMTLGELKRGISSYVAPAGRMCIRKSPRFTVLDDAYNANPSSVMAAINVLSGVSGRKICVLGDMFELGEHACEHHESVGAYAAEHKIDLILCVGQESRATYLAAAKQNPKGTLYFDTQEALLAALGTLLIDGDTILVKASHGMRLDRTVEALLAL